VNGALDSGRGQIQKSLSLIMLWYAKTPDKYKNCKYGADDDGSLMSESIIF
jgi:hypothetical protein